MAEYIDNGVQLAWLIDPAEKLSEFIGPGPVINGYFEPCDGPRRRPGGRLRNFSLDGIL